MVFLFRMWDSFFFIGFSFFFFSKIELEFCFGLVFFLKNIKKEKGEIVLGRMRLRVGWEKGVA